AEVGHDDETAAHAWNRLLYTEGEGLGLVPGGPAHRPHGGSGPSHGWAPKRPGGGRGAVPLPQRPQLPAGEYARALTDAEQALALLEGARGAQDVALTEALAGMGRALNGLGRYADAERHNARALALVDAVYGHDHPLRAVSLNNLATALRLQGKGAEAVARYSEALALAERHFGAEHSSTSVMRTNLGDALVQQGRLAEALPHYESARASLASGGDGERLRLAAVLLSLGN
ncbi:tetratricopeptide repeat protein, partial [Pyxidicoccus sp. 3LFB2]